MKTLPSYKEIFQRNYGFFSNKEISTIKNLRVAIAGAGGLGGHIASSLSRLGIGFIRIADPELFEPHNINRQFGSDLSSIGKNKADVVSEACKKINPYLKIESWNYGIDIENARIFLKDVHLVVDVLEYFKPEIEIALHEEARKKGIWVFSGQVAGSAVSATSYNPKGVSFKKLFTKDGQFDYYKATLKMFPVFSKNVSSALIKKYISTKTYIPAYALPAPIISNLIVEQIVTKFVKNHKPIAIAPKFFGLDINTLKVAIK